MRLLIAEDDLTSRTMLAAVLQANGHEVVEARDGAEAWDRLQDSGAPQLAILDWAMPEMDGLEVVRRVRTLDSQHPPYLIMLTAKGEKKDIVSGLDAGANDYLSKPFDPGELRARVAVGCRMIEMQAELVESRNAFLHEATHDALTGLLNRRAILDILHKELARASRHGDRLVIAMADIDHFKTINDTYGHQIGDDVLCRVSMIFRTNLRDYDSVGRLGGDELLVLTPGKPGSESDSLFERVRAAVEETEVRIGEQKLRITVSIGTAHSDPGQSSDETLRLADTALYQAKKQGRNQVCSSQA